jgi:hypothetical protein
VQSASATRKIIRVISFVAPFRISALPRVRELDCAKWRQRDILEHLPPSDFNASVKLGARKSPRNIFSGKFAAPIPRRMRLLKQP